MEKLTEKLKIANNAELRLAYFFETFVDMYMDNKGWFRLAWHQYICGERPIKDIEATEAANEMVNSYVANIWNELYSTQAKTSTSNGLLPFPVIVSATSGDTYAINTVLKHYAGYIAALSMRTLYDGYGNPHLCVDDELRRSLETKLINNITKFRLE